MILVLEHGEIIGKGRHEELLQSCPAYREISDSQMGGAIVE
jgi:ATP-binding cassette subfamily B protein